MRSKIKITTILLLAGIICIVFATDSFAAKVPVVSNIPFVSDLTGTKEKPVKKDESEAENEINPKFISPDAPLILAIPGLVIPSEKIKQEEHFGNLVELLTAQGFPCRVLAYDTKDNPLTSVSDLVSERTSIATTRVGPLIMREINRENSWRLQRGLPRVKTVVFVSYSQGSVIIFEIEKSIVKYRKEYEEFLKRFGVEWERLLDDPEFKTVNEVLDDVIFIENIRIERPNEFKKNVYLQRIRNRALEKLRQKTQKLFLYLEDPTDEYPNVKHFASISSNKYPKKYDKLAQYAHELVKNEVEARKFDDFLVNFTRLRTLLEVEPRLISLSGSYFGSPRANAGFKMIKDNPLGALIGGRIAKQVDETRLGSAHQMESVEILAGLADEKSYPFTEENALFVLGMDGEKGDGYVDQSSAHLSGHTFTLINVEKDIPEKTAKDEMLTFPPIKLPEITVVPLLNIRHFPEGKTPGVAYITEYNPVFNYILAFIWEDRKWVEKQIEASKLRLRQFMIQVTFENPEPEKDVDFEKVSETDNIKLDHHFYNDKSDTYVWTGHFLDEKLTLSEEEKESDLILEAGEVVFEMEVEDGPEFRFGISVYPGSNSFVKVVVHETQMITDVPHR